MKGEVESFKQARQKLIDDRDEKIKELEDTKDKKLNESKRNIEEKINALRQESESLRVQLPSSRKDYATHKKESKKLVTIIDANNKRKRELKDNITLMNNEIFALNGKNKDLQSLVDALKENLKDKNASIEGLKKELEDLTQECVQIQQKIVSKNC